MWRRCRVTDREKIIGIIDKWANKAVITQINGANVYDQNNASELTKALLAANIGDVTAWKERAEKERVIALPGGRIKQLYSDEEVEQIVKERDELKERAGSEIKSCYKEIAEKRDEIAKLRKQLKRAQNAAKKQNRRTEVAERALVIMAERVLEYAEKANVTAMTSDGLFSYEKGTQLALLANDALLKAEQKMTEE